MFRSLHLFLKALGDIEKGVDRVIQRIQAFIDIIQRAIELYKEFLALLTDDDDERVKKLDAMMLSLDSETQRMTTALEQTKGENQ